MRINLDGCIGELTTLPGCTQIVVSHSVFLPKNKRGLGKGSKAHSARLAYMEDLGYDYAICTVDATNTAEISILEKNGWNKLSSFLSSKTNHLVLLYGRQIPSSEQVLNRQFQQFQNIDILN